MRSFGGVTFSSILVWFQQG